MPDRPPHLSELVADAGRALYGDDWQNPLARLLGINERTMRRIAAAAREGEAYPVAPGALRDLLAELEQRRGALAEVAEAIRSAHLPP